MLCEAGAWPCASVGVPRVADAASCAESEVPCGVGPVEVAGSGVDGVARWTEGRAGGAAGEAEGVSCAACGVLGRADPVTALSGDGEVCGTDDWTADAGEGRCFT